jgi:hypothetical protein
MREVARTYQHMAIVAGDYEEEEGHPLWWYITETALTLHAYGERCITKQIEKLLCYIDKQLMIELEQKIL